MIFPSFLFFHTGILDKKTWFTYFNDGLVFLHEWPAVSGTNEWLADWIYCCVIFSVSRFHPLIGFEKDLSFFCAFLSSSSPTNLVSWTYVYYLLQVIRSHDLGNWTLQIKYPHLRDNGVYECQINTEPKMSLSYVLNVVGKTRATNMWC